MIPILALIVIAVTVVATIARQTASDTRSSPAAQAILDRRLAAGELSPDEHARRSAVLTEAPTARSRPGTGVVLAGVAIVVLLVASFAWGGARSSWPYDDRQMAAHMGSSAAGGAAAPVAGAAEFEIVAIDLRFEPTRLTIGAGVPVNLTLVNDGDVFHDLTIPALGFMLDAQAGERASGSLIVEESGTYEWWCSVPGHAEAGMRGILVVQSGGLS